MKIYFCIFLCLCIAMSCRDTNDFPDFESNFAAIIVSDMDASISWYTDNLGFEVITSTDLEERGLKQANLKRDGVSLELIELKASVSMDSLLNTYPSKTKAHGFFKFGYRISEFDSWVEEFQSKGVAFSGDVVKDPVTGKKMFIVFDPDGNRIQFFER